MTPIFREYAKKYEIECCPERLAILTLDVSKVEFDNVLGRSKELSKKGCRPLFVLVRNGRLVAKVEDADAPKLEALITKNLPPPPAAVEGEFDEEDTVDAPPPKSGKGGVGRPTKKARGRPHLSVMG